MISNASDELPPQPLVPLADTLLPFTKAVTTANLSQGRSVIKLTGKLYKSSKLNSGICFIILMVQFMGFVFVQQTELYSIIHIHQQYH